MACAGARPGTRTGQTRYLAAYHGDDSGARSVTLPSGAVARYLTGGCEGRARAELFGSVRAAIENALVPNDVERSLDRFLAADRRFQAALHGWRACMARGGRRVGSPAAAIRSLQTRSAAAARPADLAAQERDEASADLRCGAASTLRGTMAQERSAFLGRQPAATVTWLARIERARQQAVLRGPTSG